MMQLLEELKNLVSQITSIPPERLTTETPLSSLNLETAQLDLLLVQIEDIYGMEFEDVYLLMVGNMSLEELSEYVVRWRRR